MIYMYNNTCNIHRAAGEVKICFLKPIPKFLFQENVSLLSTYKFIVISIKYHNFGAFVYVSAEKQMWLLNNERTNLIE